MLGRHPVRQTRRPRRSDRSAPARLYPAGRLRRRTARRKRIARRTRAAGIRGKTPRRWKTTTIDDPHAQARPDLAPRVTTRPSTETTYRRPIRMTGAGKSPDRASA